MKKLEFKTSINCGSCIRTVTSYLQSIKEIEKWEVDIDNENKILTVYGDDIKAEKIVAVIQDAGYMIQPF